jgi:hypothetical protein
MPPANKPSGGGGAKPPQSQKHDVYLHLPEEMTSSVNKKLDDILTLLRQVLSVEVAQMATLEELQTEVTENTDLTGSVIGLVNGLADQLEAALANNDPAAVQAVVDQMRANNQALADAVAANTEVNPL